MHGDGNCLEFSLIPSSLQSFLPIFLPPFSFRPIPAPFLPTYIFLSFLPSYLSPFLLSIPSLYVPTSVSLSSYLSSYLLTFLHIFLPSFLRPFLSFLPLFLPLLLPLPYLSPLLFSCFRSIPSFLKELLK